MNRDKVREDAKKLMDEFFLEISSLDVMDISDKISEDPGTRIPKNESRDTIKTSELLKNAPKKNDSFVLAERKSW